MIDKVYIVPQRVISYGEVQENKRRDERVKNGKYRDFKQIRTKYTTNSH